MKHEMPNYEKPSTVEEDNEDYYAEDGDGKYHVGPEGKPLYEERYEYVGQFKNNLAKVVTNWDDAEGAFHILEDGTPAYDQKYSGVSSFSEGLASVNVNNDGEEYITFIDQLGKVITGLKFIDVYEFENGKAKVQLPDGEMAVLLRDGTLAS